MFRARPLVAPRMWTPRSRRSPLHLTRIWTAGCRGRAAARSIPPIPEGKQAHWRDKRTCVLPVKLQSGHHYRVGINSTSYRNFRSEAGVPALTSAIYFTTEGTCDPRQLQPQVPKMVRMMPPLGAKDVSPDLKELRVTFNVPMGKGFSWTGGGPEYPHRPGRQEGVLDGGWQDVRAAGRAQTELAIPAGPQQPVIQELQERRGGAAGAGGLYLQDERAVNEGRTQKAKARRKPLPASAARGGLHCVPGW